jgi:hypothetical protein
MPNRKDADQQIERLRKLCEDAEDLSRSANRLCEALTDRMKQLRAEDKPERRRGNRKQR